jgi:Trk-type K+ transport system membrane component
VRLSIVVHVTGTLTRLFAPAFLAPVAVAVFYREWTDAIGFVVAFLVTALVGAGMRRAGGPAAEDIERLRRIEGIGIVAFTWLGEYLSWLAPMQLDRSAHPHLGDILHGDAHGCALYMSH